jgi:hypothetical protein
MKCTSLALEREWNTTSPPNLMLSAAFAEMPKKKKKLKPDRRPRDIDDNDAFLLFLS